MFALNRAVAGLVLLVIVACGGCSQQVAPDAGEAPGYSTRLGDIGPRRVNEYLGAELRAEVDELIRAVAAEPTVSVEQIRERAPLLWKWANAYSLTGRPIDPELPSILAAIMHRASPPGRLREAGRLLDWRIAEFAFRDAYPEAISQLTSERLGPFQVNSYATLAQTYVVGEAPIQPGGGFLVSVRNYGGEGRSMQWQDPSAAGYVSVHSSNPRVRFEIDDVMVRGMFSGQLGGEAPRPYFRVTGAALRPGDSVEIVVGDTAGGGPGLQLASPSSSAMRARVWVSLSSANELFALDELPFHSEGGPASGLRGFGPSVAAVGEPIRITVRHEDAFRNRATSGFQAFSILDGDRVLQTVSDARALHVIDDLVFDTPGVRYLKIVSSDGRLVAEVNPLLVEQSPRQRIYWGETHGHTGFAEGAGTVENFFTFAEEDARLDFMTLSEHDIWMDDSEWEALRNHVIEGNRPGRFLTYLGYEWTQQARFGGHHNVLFRSPENRRRAERQRAPEVEDLYRILAAEHDVEDVLIIPHAHNPGRWWETDTRTERLVEIVSNHGTFDWLGNAFLRSGILLGFIGGSDDHIGHPGIRPLSNAPGGGSDNFGGLAAVLAPALDRDLVFDALRNRQTYATNGQRMILQVEANGHAMGREIPAAESVALSGRVIGTGAIDRIELVRNGDIEEIVDYLEAGSPSDGWLEVRLYSDADPQERGVQSRPWRQWQGTLSVSNARLVQVETPNTENVFTESARVSADDAQVAEFFVKTRGAPKSIRLRLADVGKDAALHLQSSSRDADLVSRVVDLNRLSNEDVQIQTVQGRFADQITVRWVAPSNERDRPIDFTVTDAAPGDTYYVRVTQQDGGIAWSSPARMHR